MENQRTNRSRLNKVIADSGLVSRRRADRLIEDGHVSLNGKKVYELGIKVDPEKDKILVDGKPLKRKGESVYAIFHKPRGVLTTMEDPLGRPTVSDFLERLPVRLFPVGRLDWDSEGLLLLTNDGDYANKIMHPQREVTKTYLVKLDGLPRPEQLLKLRRGVSIIGGRVAAKFAARVERGKDKRAWIKIVITEGKNRQIRQMFQKIGFDVLKLQRIAIGQLRLGGLPRGEIAFLNETAAGRVFKQDLSGEQRETRRSANQRLARPKSLKKNVGGSERTKIQRLFDED
ncbi:MAG: rRNA pseudouridine synthase [Bdellovibrio sp.]|nr:MAG: rRNA pseudouridine synthase [Bdellovibrio sp.]